ncbi:hypothetical protein MKW92_048080 [Papaver armeniacum]|nr:hypothetical protein MKW92_048080 [Papaver armeniacum]
MKGMSNSHFILFIHIYLLFITFSCTAKPPFACDLSNPSTNSYAFCNTSLPISERVGKFNLSLGIPSYQWWSESLHGVSSSGRGIKFNGETISSATSFPQVILTASSFHTHLWYRIGQAIGVEARAVYNAGQASGMTFWAPNINIFRDPRWGRGQETPGEDPMVTSRYSVSYVRGIQGDSFKEIIFKFGKHFTLLMI